MKNFLGVIPARYASTRFPGKPLVNIHGKSMILRVYEKVSETLENVVVATDDNRIFDAVLSFGGKAVMTSEKHKSGTDRCFEALLSYEESSNKKFDVVINVQGDEPFIKPEQISQLMECFNEKSVDIATLIKPINANNIIFDPNRPKVVVNKRMEATYFSRSPIPYLREVEQPEWHKRHTFYQHIGMYAYRSKVLSEITKLEQGNLEFAESLEQLRWLENGYTIKTAITEFESLGIDTPEDLKKVLDMNLI